MPNWKKLNLLQTDDEANNIVKSIKNHELSLIQINNINQEKVINSPVFVLKNCQIHCT